MKESTTIKLTWMINLFIFLKQFVKTRLWSTATVTLSVVSFWVNFSTVSLNIAFFHCVRELHFLYIFSVLIFFYGQNSGKLKTHCTGHWSPSLTASRWTWKLCVWTRILFVMSIKNVVGVPLRCVYSPWQHVNTFSWNCDTDLNARPVARYFWN